MNPRIAIPLLLQVAELPSDIFNLFLSLGVVASRFGDAMKTMHLIAFATLTTSILLGIWRVRWRVLLLYLLVSLLVVGGAITGIRAFLEFSFKDVYSKEQLLIERSLLNEPVEATTLTTAAPNPQPLEEGEGRIARMLRRGIIRVGYDSTALPFAYLGSGGELVGFDIDMAHRLARDLGVAIEFVPCSSRTVVEQLVADHFDVAMSGFEGTLKRAASLPLGDSYLDVTLALVVLDHTKSAYNSLAKLQAKDRLRLAAVAESFFAERLSEALPHVEVVILESEASFFNDDSLDVDALVTSAETGSAWTLLRPQYSVVNPLSERVRVPLYYLTAPDEELREFIKRWLELKRKSGLLDRLYDHWILGQQQEVKQPRWSVVRDVLGWID